MCGCGCVCLEAQFLVALNTLNLSLNLEAQSNTTFFFNFINTMKIKPKIVHNVRTVPNSNQEIVETESKSIHLTHIYIHLTHIYMIT